jgi:hypothetical protein
MVVKRYCEAPRSCGQQSECVGVAGRRESSINFTPSYNLIYAAMNANVKVYCCLSWHLEMIRLTGLITLNLYAQYQEHVSRDGALQGKV